MKICYINFNFKCPRDQITLHGLKENGIIVKEITDRTPGWKKYVRIARAYRESETECDAVIVGYTGSILVIFMRLLTRKKIFYNALSSFYDSMIVSRQKGRALSLSATWYYLIDWLAFRLATHSFIECQTQKDLVVRVFGVNPRKLSVHFVGTDDEQLYFDPTIPKLYQFTVVFRGNFLPEAGVDVILRASKELEDEGIAVRIIGRGLLQKEIEHLMQELKPTNLEFITEMLPIEELRKKMQECHLSLGQLANHPRVHTTIPHKAFDSMAMKLPYLTGKNRGVMEILEDNKTCFTVPPGDYRALARKIVELRDRQSELEQVAENAYRLYQQKFTPKILVGKMLEDIRRHTI